MTVIMFLRFACFNCRIHTSIINENKSKKVNFISVHTRKIVSLLGDFEQGFEPWTVRLKA